MAAGMGLPAGRRRIPERAERGLPGVRGLGRSVSPRDSRPRRAAAGVALTHRETLVADAAHREAVVAGVHRPGQHLVQVHVGALSPATDAASGSCPGSADAPRPSSSQGRRPLWGGGSGSDGRREPERRSRGPQLIPSAGGRSAEGAGAAGRARCGARVRAPVTARVGPGDGTATQQLPPAVHTPARGTSPSINLSWLLRG